MKTKDLHSSIHYFKVDFFKLKIVAFLFLLTTSLKAGNEYFSTRLKGNQVSLNAELHTRDTMFERGLSPDWIGSNKISYQRVTNRILLKVDTAVYSPDFYSCAIGLEIRSRDKDNHERVYTPTLTVEFHNGLLAEETDQFLYQFYGAHDVTVKIVSVVTNIEGTVSATVPPNLILENNMVIKRFYEFDQDEFVTGLTMVQKNGGSEFEVSWPPVVGAEEYQLEWLFVNSYDGDELNSDRSALSILYDFNENATRINLPSSVHSYTVSNVFERGWIGFRYRAVGLTGADFKTQLAGRWSCAPCNGAVGAFTTSNFYKIDAHQQDKINWMYNASYAEEGKKKESIGYMDGTFKNRQTVSKLNTENQTIVGETIYDKEGRLAVSILPSPSGTNVLKYNKNYNRNADGDDYSSTDFESNTNPCVNHAAQLST
ncbi:MAG TPA: hypothetical protein VLB84_00030, partial [Bacteroidia bacterium]|nr:hypothetical protein [Bacteroidia bacterium]